jgi:aminopeptidase YwaD
MFQHILSKVKGALSGTAAKEYVAEIARYHRIQASPGFRQAATYVHGALARRGLSVETLSFAGDGKTFYWASLVPPEWDASAAELWLTGPDRKRLADFRECKISLIQRSDATPPGGVEAELVALQDGAEEAHYAGLDVAGKVVLTSSSDLRRVRALAVDVHGAIGILYDGMADAAPIRTRIDLPDARQYVSFWQSGEEKSPCFGFSLSPRLGDDLRRRLKSARPGEPVRVWAWVDSHFVPDGHTEVVSALIPGQCDEEVVVVAHLCHPQPSANDNASGAGAAMEITFTLHDLIARGDLPIPKRSIRFLWVAEMTGTYAYLATRPERIAKMVAAINLDMVGQNQEICGSSFLIERLPRALPSFVDDLVIRIREDMTSESPSHSGQGGYALYRHAITPFSGGSDHYILSDPTVAVPCPMLIQWPDKFYHTSEDTIEKVDPASLQRAGVLSATYAYFIANAGEKEAAWLGHEMNARFRSGLIAAVQNHLTMTMQASSGEGESVAAGFPGLQRRIDWDLAWLLEALPSLRRLAPGMDFAPLQAQASASASEELAHGRAALQALGLAEVPQDAELGKKRSLTALEERAAAIVPLRLVPGPVSLLGYLPRLSAEDREAWRVVSRDHAAESRLLPTLALYWADGKRSLLDIVDAVEMESGLRSPELILPYFELLRKLRLVSWAE